MITKEGFNIYNEHYWRLHVPDKHCVPGLEVLIVATDSGLEIGGNIISWGELEVTKREAQKIRNFESRIA
jgi:hypothetical protein